MRAAIATVVMTLAIGGAFLQFFDWWVIGAAMVACTLFHKR